MRPELVKRFCISVLIMDKYDEADVDSKEQRRDKNEEILKILQRNPGKFCVFREILRGTHDCHSVIKELDCVGPDPSMDRGMSYLASFLTLFSNHCYVLDLVGQNDTALWHLPPFFKHYFFIDQNDLGEEHLK